MKRNLIIILLSVIISVGASYPITSKIVDSKLSTQDLIEEISNTQNNHDQNRSNRTIAGLTATGFCDAAEMAVQTVVYVKVVQKAKYQSQSFYDLIFGFPQTPKDQVGLGSGVIIRSDGYIVTNNHVVNGADQIQVTLENNQVYDAKLIGTDPATDLALLKIDAKDLPAIELGDSDELRLGEWVLAIGSPYDLRSTITAGIVSAKGRSLPQYDGQYRVESFIQTDAAVNPGNSGGALVNAAGQLVGINTSIMSLTGSYTGYSFAVPVNIVKKITNDFIEYGSVQRALLGIGIVELNADVAKRLGIDRVDGIYVAEIQQGSAAQKGGIKVGDVITEINLNKVKNNAAVQEQISKLRPGEQAVVTVIRDGVQKEIIVKF